MTAGKRDGASFIVIYLHGRGGNRLQGMNDFTFGGNFNRVKNLAVLNDGFISRRISKISVRQVRRRLPD